MKNFIILALGVTLFFSCTEENENYLTVTSDRVVMKSDNLRFEKPFDDFKLYGDSLVFCDTITLDDAVQTNAYGFKQPRAKELISSRMCGNYEIKKYCYESAFEVWISSYTHEPRLHCLNFCFEAEEIWLDDKCILKQPHIFVKKNSSCVNLPKGDEDIYAKYLLTFEIDVYNQFLGGVAMASFDYKYYVVRTNDSVWNDRNDDVFVVVTCDWHPSS